METEMIDGEPYSVDELRYKRDNDPDWLKWLVSLSTSDLDTVEEMLMRRNIFQCAARGCDGCIVCEGKN